MKIKITILLIALFVISCSKENSFRQQASRQSNISAAVVDTAKIPINDLGTGTFRGFIGGLYPNGLNYPTGVYANDLLATCKKITPLDTFGNASPNGKVVFVSLGFSTGDHNMEWLQAKTTGNPLTNQKLKLLRFNQGSGLGLLNHIMDPDDPYWTNVATRIKNNKTSFRQVQIIYLETEDSSNVVNFPARPKAVKQNLETCFRVFKQKFKNVKLVYLLARTTTYDNQYPRNTEPSPYYLGWACKWAIGDQIHSIPGTEYKGVNAVSPMITWAFYQWDRETTRITDGFKWTRDLMGEDGLHANDVGLDTLSTRFQNFLLTDKYAKNWYAAQ